VIAIGAEFSVLLYLRFLRERSDSSHEGTVNGFRAAYSSTGAAIFASGTTAIAGFAALSATDIKLLRDFSIVAVVDLFVSLVGVMLLLPAAVLWSERGYPVRLPDVFGRGNGQAG